MLSIPCMSEEVENYYIFAEDRQAYGPADANVLREWAQNGSVSPESWVYAQKSDTWCRAKQIAILQQALPTASPTPEPTGTPSGLKGGQLRRIRLFADMSDQQAEQFVNLVEKVKV